MALTYDPKLPSSIADPYPVFCQLREQEPLHRSHVLGGVVLTRYADVKACLNDPRLSSDRITPFVRYQRDRAHAAELQKLGRTASTVSSPCSQRHCSRRRLCD